MTIRLALLAAAVGTALVAAGCTSSRAGTPHVASGSASTSASVSEPAATGSSQSSADRPKPLDLTGIDPCQLLVAQQLAPFAVDRPARPGAAGANSLLAGSPGCTFGSGAEETGFLVLASTAVGLSDLLSKIKPNPSRQTVSVKGYPAAQEEGELSAPERGSGVCFVDVDVADGQLLEVQFSQISATPEKRLPIETLCANARQVAEAALTTLQGG